MDGDLASKPGGATAPLRRAAAACCAALLLGAGGLLAAGIYGAIYQALESGGPSKDMVLHLAPRALCALLRTCPS